MFENSDKKPTRFSWAKYEWAHWLVVTFFLIGGILALTVPSIITEKFLIGPVIVGLLFIGLGVFSIVCHVVYIKRLKAWEKMQKIEEQNPTKTKSSN